MDDPTSTEAGAQPEQISVLSCRAIRKTWPSGGGVATPALDSVDLDVGAGESVAILGPSGCGKTTLLRIFAGLDAPDGGWVTARGAAISGPSPDRPLVFQQPTLFPWLNVWENISFGLGLKGVARGERRSVAQALLSACGLPDVADRHPEVLSLGMRQRVAVVRALAIHPPLLLLDEPFAALDVQTRRRMQGFLRQIQRTSGAAVVLVTHDIEEALAVCDRIVLLSARPGRVLLEAPGTGPRARFQGRPDARSRNELERLLSEEADRAFAQDVARL